MPKVENQWEEGLEIQEALLMVSKGSCCSVLIPISNTSNHDITIKKGSMLGTLETVQSIITLPADLKGVAGKRADTHQKDVMDDRPVANHSEEYMVCRHQQVNQILFQSKERSVGGPPVELDSEHLTD